MTHERPDTLIVEAAHVRYVCDGKEAWAFPLGDLRLLGEWTNCSGPYGDDYFYLFAVGSPARFYEAPMYANHRLAEVLSLVLGTDLQLGLVSSTELASRVVWPPTLAGQPLFDYKPHSRGTGLLGRVMDRVAPLVDSGLTNEVAAFLNVEDGRRTSACT